MIPGYVFFYRGAWREVTNMFQGKHEVNRPEIANAVVIRVGDGHVGTEASPGEIFTSDERAVGSQGSWDSI